MRLSQLFPHLSLQHDDEVQAIATNSRELTAKTWWFAAKGVEAHALDYAPAALHCAGVVYEPPYTPVSRDWIACPHLGAQLGEVASRFYDNPSKKLRVFAVTGTDGKSSLVHFLAQACDAAMIGTIGTGKLQALQPASHTTPDALKIQRLLARFVDDDISRVAMEVSSHALVQHRIAGVDIDVAVFSNLSRDHLDYHKTMEAYFLAKAQLFALPIAHAVINLDDAYGRRLLDEKRIHPDAIIWGVSSHGSTHTQVDHLLNARDIVLSHDGIGMSLVVDGRCLQINTKLLARFNVDNILNVAACLLSDGVTLEALPARIAALHGVPGRVERIGLPEQRSAIVDYAHTPGALENALQGVRAHINGRLWVIFGCGGNRDSGKRPLMAAAAERYADCVVVTDDNPRHEQPDAIVADIMRGFRHLEQVEIIQPREVAIRHVLSVLQPGDAVLIAGKGHENYQIIGDIRHSYSDQQVVQAWKNAQCS